MHVPIAEYLFFKTVKFAQWFTALHYSLQQIIYTTNICKRERNQQDKSSNGTKL